MSSPADSTANAVSILFPIYFDVSGINAELFGQDYDVSGQIIRVRQKLAESSFYVSENDSYISFRQDTNEDIFEVDISAGKAAQIAQDISASLHLYEGATYDVTKRGADELDCSGVTGFNGTGAFEKYNSIQDFVISYFAYKVLGHPGALAAISNDASIRGTASSVFAASVFSNKLSSSVKAEGTMTDDDAKAIVQQVMNQDLSRFNLIDKRADGYTPLPLRAGDKIYVQIRMSNNKYYLKQTVANPSTITTGLVNPASQSATGTPSDIPSENDQYLLEFMIGATVEDRTDY
jgi:hypothetical protein